MRAKNRTLFLDRDGTINVDIGYVRSPDEIQLINGSAHAIVRAKQAGFLISIITNQAGVAKGITPRDALPEIHRRIEDLISVESGTQDFRFDDIQVCVHHPLEKCLCRKPQTLMVEQSMKKLGTDPLQSFFVGDKCSDLICADRVGIAPFLVLTGHGIEAQAELPEKNLRAAVRVVRDLQTAIDQIIAVKS